MSPSNPASKIFIAFQLIEVKNCQNIAIYQFNLAALLLVRMVVGWVEFWCTRCRYSAPLIKSLKFLRKIVLFAKGKKSKK